MDRTFAVSRYEPSAEDAWDDLVRRSASGHFLFRRDYLEYHADRFEDCSLVVHDGARLVAALPANRDGDRVVSHGGLTFGGLLADPGLRTAGTLRAFDAILGHLRESGVRRLTYKAVPHIYHRFPAEEDLYALFRHDAALVRRDLSSAIRLDNRLPYNELRRRSVRKGLALGIAVEQTTDFAAFHAILAGAVARHGARPAHSADELALLAGRFPESIRLFGAALDGELAAGVLVYETETVAHAQYIGATPEGQEANVLSVVLDHLIAFYGPAKRYFDFGISTTDSGRRLNAGLAANKESYGARGVAYDQYEVEL
jgi:hypothetical protein